jgi:MFS transporter, ACS family, tartrate transporter
MPSQASDLPPVAVRARGRILRRLLPYLFFLYIIAFLDRVNVGYAKLEMAGDLGFSDSVYGFGAGIFFFGYFLLEVPGSLIVERWSARKWIARIMITWGLLAVLMGFIQTTTHFYVIRFLLGAAEAGFFPGVIVYLSHWFRYEDRAKAVALFMSAIPVSNIVGAPISGLLLDIDWLGLEGWRWLFILEGIPAIIFGIVTVYFLTDRPHQAKWLPEVEREWIVGELERERATKEATRRYGILEAIRDPKVVLLTCVYFMIVTGGYGLIFWLPTFVKQASGASNLQVTLLTAATYMVGFVGMILTGWSSDRTGERRWHTAVPMFIGGVAFLAAIAVQDHIVVAMVMFSIASYGFHAYLPPFWSLPTTFLTGSAAAATVGFVNSVGNLGGFLGPYLLGYIAERTGSSLSGGYLLSALAFGACALVLTFRSGSARPVQVPMEEAESPGHVR